MSRIVSRPIEERKAESRALREKYPDFAPVIIQLHERSRLPQTLHNHLLSVPRNFAVRDLTHAVRKKVRLSKTTVMSLFIDRRYLLSPDLTVSEMYDRWCSEDGFVYILCSDQEQLG